MRAITINAKGEKEVDPSNMKGLYEKWHEKITSHSKIDYYSLRGIAPIHSEYVTKYVLDLAVGKNTAKGHRKGPRSYIHLVHVRYRLNSVFKILEKHTSKGRLNFTEDDILNVFNAMRAGRIRNANDKPFLDVSTYAKVFCAFWRWYIRTNKDKVIPNIVDSLDTRADHKPKWHYFTLQDVEKMAITAPNYEYETLMYFIFDSGIRAPKELMNVRVCDLTPVPKTNQMFLEIRDETSKTFGRKIKLMISSEKVKKYIKQKKLIGKDFLFTKSPICYNRTLATIAFRTFGIGEPHYQYNKRGWRVKTLIKGGITMYDFRHNSVCHYLPIYKSENQMKYRYGWKKSDMIHYYSEFIGMKDTISEDDMLVDVTKTQLEQELQKERQKVEVVQEQMEAQRKEFDERMKKLEAMMLQKFADG
jgi:hypothetical protein